METNKKKPYKKPQLQEVKLVPEEAVLTACKTANGLAGGTRTCRTSRGCSGATSAVGS